MQKISRYLATFISIIRPAIHPPAHLFVDSVNDSDYSNKCVCMPFIFIHINIVDAHYLVLNIIIFS